MADESERRERKKPAPGEDFVPRTVIVVVAVAVVLVTGLVFYSLVVFWPTTTAGGRQPSFERVNYFGWVETLSRETLFFLVVALGGALGGLIHTIRSMSWYVGNHNLLWSWMLFNLMLPLVGALAGTVFYIVLRAGLFSPSTSAASVSPYGFTAVAIMAGLFSEQAMEKLRQLASDLFSERPEGKDHVEPESVAEGDDGSS
ncbi:MAG: hypothetical protein ABWY51_07245 [Gaiellaceae bacterium]